MKKKTFAAIALTSCIAFGATFTGCSLISTNNRLDMEQVIATVDISKSEKFDTGELKDYKSVCIFFRNNKEGAYFVLPERWLFLRSERFFL